MYVLGAVVLLQALSSIRAFNLSSLFSFSSPTVPTGDTHQQYTSSDKQKTVLVLVANGTEELEAVTTISILSYAGIAVTVASVDGIEAVRCARGVTILPDAYLEDVVSSDFDGIVIPGGKEATDKMSESADVGDILRRHGKEYRFIGVTTSASLVLNAHQVYFGKRLTSSPECKKQLSKNYDYQTWDTVVDGSLITSRYPGFSMQFALSMVNHLTSKLIAEHVAKQLIPSSNSPTFNSSLITSRYPGFSLQFALAMVNHLTSKLVAENVSKQLIPFRTFSG